MKYSVFATLSLALTASARPNFLTSKRADFTLKNGEDAIALNDKFKTLTPTSACTNGDVACVNDKFAECANGKFAITACAGGLICAALPLDNSAGTTVTCTTAADRDARIAATGAKAGATGTKADDGKKATGGKNTSSAKASGTKAAAPPTETAGNNAANGDATGDPQKSLTLSKDSIQANYANDGSQGASAGQEPSLTSTDNFINFCLQFPGKQKTNGQQVIEGSCNQTPMGLIAAKTNMPSAKFQAPANGDKIAANKDFTIKLAINNLETGHFTNPATTFHMAPQTVNAQGNIKGHSHVVIQKLAALDQTTPVSPTDFVFFKGLNEKAVNGVLTTTVPGGLPKGVYRIATINSSSNHQPALVAVAQRGALDDMVYFTVA
ncbi:hypothetical protein GSI_13386 [Ganoderma sinense ZZ0214-1]|uniref:Carbohydrate-binding module family 19 domain-containing protein n=1 Tax=Ganoderma sinense ZZ0214-1 TaxID=1077348 RepID=A0A2G8RVE6_9APHY|nr:hypothetical protein GSI_13386 [Ganoderma sinense ZZ0214-1]